MSVKTLYNPATLSKDELAANFVVRTKVFDKIFKDIKSSTMKYPEKHYLIQGQRGMGKTTLLLRLKYEIENTPTLNSWLIPVFFGEESYDLTSLSRLWEKLLAYLDDEWDTGGIHYEHTEAFVDFGDYEKRCFEYLIETLRANEKKIILFFDNFGQLFLDNLTEKEKRRLREVLMNCNDIRIVGASAIVLQDLHNYAEPFYEFFNVVHLEGLTKEETFQLIERLQEHCEEKIDLKKNKAKIETLAILTGGVIRTLMMVYQVLLNDQDGSALNDLEIVLDQVTPLYKHRIEDLPVQQRRIVDVIAKHWDAVSAKEIAVQIREDGKSMATKLVSAHLQQLEKSGIVEKKATGTKNHLYQLEDRFFNIWYLMRVGGARGRQKVQWLVEYFYNLYNRQKPAKDIFSEPFETYHASDDIAEWHLLTHDIQAGDFDTAYERIINLVNQSSAVFQANPGQAWHLNENLLLLMQRNQYHTVFRVFETYGFLKELLKPTYYALMTQLKEEHPNAVLRMGRELSIPVYGIKKDTTSRLK